MGPGGRPRGHSWVHGVVVARPAEGDLILTLLTVFQVVPPVGQGLQVDHIDHVHAVPHQSKVDHVDTVQDSSKVDHALKGKNYVNLISLLFRNFVHFSKNKA
jgi:hypothetical protein